MDVFDPPPELVKLLKSNKAVLGYFKTLQRHLKNDVEEWKTRANNLESKLKELQKEVAKLKKTNKSNLPTTVRRHDNLDTDEQKKQTITNKKVILSNNVEDDQRENKNDHEPQDGYDSTEWKNAFAIGEKGTNNESSSDSDDEALLLEEMQIEDRPDTQLIQQDTTNKKPPSSPANELEITDDMLENELMNGDQDSSSSEASDHLLTKDPKFPENETDPSLEMLEKELMNDDGDSSSDESSSSRTSLVTGSSEHATKHSEISRGIGMEQIQLEQLRKAMQYLSLIGVSMIECPETTTKAVKNNEDKDNNKDLQDGIKEENLNKAIDSSVSLENEDVPMREDDENVGIQKNNDVSTSSEDSEPEESFIIMNSNGGEPKRSIKPKGPQISNISQEANIDVHETENCASRIVQLERRSNAAVARDLMHAIHILTKASLESCPKFWTPFMSSEYLPCFVPLSQISEPESQSTEDAQSSNADTESSLVQHPAVEGIGLITKALLIIDVWSIESGDTLFDIEVGQGDFARDEIIVGMRHRRGLIQSILDTIEIEATTGVWAAEERELRLRPNFAAAYLVEDESTEDETVGRQDLDFTVNQTRWASLAERCANAHLASHLLLGKEDFSRCFEMIFGYIVASVPRMEIEGYNIYPPTLSFCVLESFLFAGDDASISGWFAKILEKLSLITNCSSTSWVTKALSFAICSTAKILKDRTKSTNSRIRDFAIVELKAYKRILKSHSWVSSHFQELDDLEIHTIGRQLVDEAAQNIRDFASGCFPKDIDERLKHRSLTKDALPALSLILINTGDVEQVKGLYNCILQSSKWGSEQTTIKIHAQIGALHCCIKSYISLLSVRVIGLPQVTRFVTQKLDIEWLEEAQRILMNVFHEVNSSICNDGLNTNTIISRNIISDVFLKISTICVSGETLLKIAGELIVDNQSAQRFKASGKFSPSEKFPHPLPNLVLAAEFPVARVINLERRQDRWRFMVSQATMQHILLAKALAPMSIPERPENGVICPCVFSSSDYVWGGYAVDGIGSDKDFHDRINSIFNGETELENYVLRHWRPHVLKFVDKFAPKEDVVVVMDPTERACAMSHILSWKGVERSLMSCDVHGENRSRKFITLFYESLTGCSISQLFTSE